MKFNLIQKSCYVLILITLFGCKTIPTRPTDINYELFETSGGVGYLISANSIKYDIRVAGTCLSGERKYKIGFFEKNTTKKQRQPQWVLINNDKKIETSKKYTEEEIINYLTNLQIGQYTSGFRFTNKIDLSSNELLNLPTLCAQKQNAFINKNNELYSQEQNRIKKLIDSVKASTGLQPMFKGANQKSFNELVYIFLKDGFSQYENKFVWVSDGDYKISQVLKGKILLTSYNADLLPITIITSSKVLEGQKWSKISGAPLEFVGVVNYTTILNISKQTIVLKHL